MTVSDLLVNAGLVLLFVLIGGFFAAAEIALVSLRDSQIERLSMDGRRGRILADLARVPNRFLAAVQVGVTLAGFVSAGFGASQIAPSIAPVFQSWGLAEGLSGVLAFILVTVVIAYVSLVVGELVPKRLALQRAESTALAVAAPVELLARLARPFIWLLSVSTNGLVRLLGGDPQTGREHITGEELRDMVAAHEDLSVEERTLIDDVFEAGDRELREVMLPRTEVEFLDAGLLVAEAAQTVAEAPHSRYPVIRDSADDVIGFVHVRDLLTLDEAKRSMRVGTLARKVPFFPWSKAVIPALTEMRRRGQHLAIVVDEYGGTAGIVTLEDLVEELVGDIRDEYDAPMTVLTSEVDGLLNLEDFAERTGLELPEGPYETVAGFVMARLGSLPVLGSTVEVEGCRLSVTAMDGRRIARIRVSPVNTDASPESQPPSGEPSMGSAASLPQ